MEPSRAKGEAEPSTGDQTEEPSEENVEAIEPLKAQKDMPVAGAETSVEPSVHWQAAQPGAAGSTRWQRPATWPDPKEVPPPGPDAPHVVLSYQVRGAVGHHQPRPQRDPGGAGLHRIQSQIPTTRSLDTGPCLMIYIFSKQSSASTYNTF